jgi:hypothetical protein
MNDPTNRNRRSLLKGAALFAGGTLAATLIPSERARAQKTPQSAVAYQEKPNNGQKCADCNFFQPPHSCMVVDGNINPDGWCKLFTPKAKK